MAPAAVEVSVSPSFVQVLLEANLTLAISTYQADRLLVSQVYPDETFGIDFQHHDRPMGIAVREDVVAVGERQRIAAFRDHPPSRSQQDADGHYLPLWQHETADVMIHELVYCAAELWFVNTLFSCLATLDRRHSFRPQWIPPFVSELAPEDRCHLNGVAVRDGRPAFVSCLATSDARQGWRDAAQPSGVIVEVGSGETVLGRLDFPHSPRWHDGRLWFLQSTRGLVCVSDVQGDQADVVAALPGFARGLAIAGGLAFVGLSKDRHATERPPGQACGVWVVDLSTGDVVASLRIEGVVTELFDVQIIPGRRRIAFDRQPAAGANSYVFSPLADR